MSSRVAVGDGPVQRGGRVRRGPGRRQHRAEVGECLRGDPGVHSPVGGGRAPAEPVDGARLVVAMDREQAEGVGQTGDEHLVVG